MDEQLKLRYSRHLMLPEFAHGAQDKLGRSSVLMIGLGGLGSPAAMYLAAAGVGRLVLVDPDIVELSNLQRQIVHETKDVERLKVDSARERLLALNPHAQIDIRARRFYAESADELVRDADVVVDGSDNFATRFAANAACYRHRKPLVTGAAVRFEGQVSVFRPGVPGSACYRCLFDDAGVEAETCEAIGVVAPLLGIIGSVQALETIKVLAGIGTDLCGRLLCLDALRMEWHTLKVRPDPSCPVCGSGATP
jgi:adenylyltransferase/sulfurtransferase